MQASDGNSKNIISKYNNEPAAMSIASSCTISIGAAHANSTYEYIATINQRQQQQHHLAYGIILTASAVFKAFVVVLKTFHAIDWK